ncbi:hypothetical protein [Mesobacillus thioparans]
MKVFLVILMVSENAVENGGETFGTRIGDVRYITAHHHLEHKPHLVMV